MSQRGLRKINNVKELTKHFWTAKNEHYVLGCHVKISFYLFSLNNFVCGSHSILLVLCFVNVFTGVPEAEVTWFKNKVKLSFAHHLHDGVLLIPNVSLSDQGLYSCKAANLRGEITESSQLLVLGKSRVSCTCSNSKMAAGRSSLQN